MKQIRGSKTWISYLLFAAGFMALSAQAAAPRAPSLCIDDANGCMSGGSYRWYPALNLDSIPFHASAGAWGQRVAVQAPAAPQITSTSNATNIAELQAAMAVPGRRVTITRSIVAGGAVVNVTTVTDVEVVIPNGILVSGVLFGSGYSGTIWNRIRFTKAPGDTIGGQVHQFRMLGASISDLVIDGLQISGSGEPAIYPTTTSGTPLRVAIVNNRIHTSTSAYGYGARHLVVAGNSVRHNAVDGSGPLSSWGFRQGGGDYTDGPYVYYQNDIRGITYFKLRFHPTLASSGYPYYFWVAENTFVDRVTSSMIGVGDLPATGGSSAMAGAWYLANRYYVGGGISQTMLRTDNTSSATYLRINGNLVYGTTSPMSTWGAPNGDASGNTYDAARGNDPPWGAAGDPTGIDWTP
jgi:hypothetical protein